MTSIPGRPGTRPRGQGSHRAANLIVGYGLTSAWIGRGIRLLLCAAVVRVVESAPRGRISSLVFRMVTGKPATVLCLASGCAAGLSAGGAIG